MVRRLLEHLNNDLFEKGVILLVVLILLEYMFPGYVTSVFSFMFIVVPLIILYLFHQVNIYSNKNRNDEKVRAIAENKFHDIDKLVLIILSGVSVVITTTSLNRYPDLGIFSYVIGLVCGTVVYFFSSIILYKLKNDIEE